MSLTLIEQVNRFTTVVVEIVTVSKHIKPYVRSHEFTGPTRFVEAMVLVTKAKDEQSVTIIGKHKSSWSDGFDTEELCHKEFATLTAISLMREVLPAFVKGVCKFVGGRNNDNASQETIITAGIETHGNWAEGHRYWQNLVAQETEIEASKAEAERLAKEIIEAKSTGKSMDSFGSGDPQV
jgi:hypothetical protein